MAADPPPEIPMDPLDRLIKFCRQTARDGITPTLAWFTETADEWEAIKRAAGDARPQPTWQPENKDE